MTALDLLMEMQEVVYQGTINSFKKTIQQEEENEDQLNIAHYDVDVCETCNNEGVVAETIRVINAKSEDNPYEETGRMIPCPNPNCTRHDSN